jgi:hypothetical protein
MNLSLEALARRRAELVQRSGAQRAEIAASIDRTRNAVTAPVLLGAGGLVALLSTSPKLREWMVRAWAVYALVRRFR